MVFCCFVIGGDGGHDVLLLVVVIAVVNRDCVLLLGGSGSSVGDGSTGRPIMRVSGIPRVIRQYCGRPRPTVVRLSIIFLIFGNLTT